MTLKMHKKRGKMSLFHLHTMSPFSNLRTLLPDPREGTICRRKTFNLRVERKDLSAHINQLIFREIEIVLPIPPNQQLIDFIFLIMIMQKI